jgi:hypothetical protein
MNEQQSRVNLTAERVKRWLEARLDRCTNQLVATFCVLPERKKVWLHPNDISI